MAANIKSAVDEEEEEEEEGPIIDVRRRKLVYKVNPVQSPDHPTTSTHLVSQSASTYSSSSSYSKSSSYMTKMEGAMSHTTSSSEHFTGQSLLPETALHATTSPFDYTQETHLQAISVTGTKQFPLPDVGQEASYHHEEHHPEQVFASTGQYQLSDVYQESQPADVLFRIGTSSDNKIIVADSSIDEESNASFTMPRDFTAYNRNPISVLNYDEMPFKVLQSNSSGTQHAALFGHAAENLLNFPTSGLDFLDSNAESSNGHNPYCHVITGLTLDGQMIVGCLSAVTSEQLSTSEKNVLSTVYTIHSNEETVSIPISEVPEDLSGQHAISSKVIAGLTTQNELVILGLSESGPENETEKAMPIVTGLTTDGQLICGGCMFDNASNCVSGKFDEHHPPLDIIANLTAENEKVLSGLSFGNDSRPYSDFSTVPAAAGTIPVRENSPLGDGGTLIRRDSF